MLTFELDADLPQECTPLAIAKNLALQLLRTNIGDIELLTALRKAHSDPLGSTDVVTLENELWASIHVGLRNSKAENPIIIVDGLDDRCGHESAISVSNRIGELASKHSHVKAIILARNAAHLPKVKTQVFPVNEDHTNNDLKHIAKQALRKCQHFLSHSDEEQHGIIHKLTQAAKGNFFWVELVTRVLKHETSHDGFMRAAKSTMESPRTVDQLLQSLISDVTGDFSKVESTQILSWLLVSERPLKIAEVKDLLRINMQKRTIASRTMDAAEIANLCGPLVMIQNGIVSFRYGSIREQLLKISAGGEKLRHLSTLQTDFVTRLLTYCTIRVKKSTSPVFECPEALDMEKDDLLEYAARNWIIHFQKSSLITKDKTLNLTADFKAAFPNSVQLVLMEWSYWKSQSCALDAASLHHLALEIRQAIFSKNNESVFQSLIICGHSFNKQPKFLDAGNYFYRATCVGRSIFKAYSAVTISCTNTFLEITKTEKNTSRTQTVTRKEESLLYLISAYKQQYGETSDFVIQYSKVLAELYVTIHEEHKAETLWKELHETMIASFGKGSAEEVSISSNLHFLLKKSEKYEEIVEYERSIFDTVMEMEIWDARRIEVTLKLAKSCESRGDLLKAEEHYVTLWRGLIDHHHNVHSHHIDIELHLSMIDISLEYVSFLRRNHRIDEAAGVLICIWAEYEEYEFESEDIFLRLKIVGDLMRAVTLLSIAVSVFKKCWSWFKSHGKSEHTDSCQTLISETVQEIIIMTNSKTTISTSTTTTTTETIVKEMFDSSIRKSTVTMETVSISRNLMSLYMKSEQWSEAIKISKRLLEQMWRVVISGGSTIALPREFSSEAIEISTFLAICHHRSHHFQEAESIYRRIYQACFNSCQVHDERFTKAYTTLVKFYEDHGHWHKVIGVYKEILVASRKHLGTKHALTIKILYRLGSLCSERGHSHAHEYYEEIITAVNGNSKVCHGDALVAMKIMCKTYFEEGNWQILKHTCEVLWETWVHHHHDHKIEAEFIEILYMRYIYVLEHHAHAEYEIIRTITIQFRDTCIRVFGTSVTITVKALVELAQVCMRSEEHIQEAISYYEEVEYLLPCFPCFN
jgi:tetratricopeptide (TPR) repeat protein